MATETFADVLGKLKELHEREVQALQAKLAELTLEKCRDTQRIEELFSKNHQLREQQKMLNENVKVLENRLRAGLCDRCTVTQELAKRKQQEFESSQFQSLQHISMLTSEVNGLKEEKKKLQEEVKNLQSIAGGKQQRGSTPEGRATTEAALSVAAEVYRPRSVEAVPVRQPEWRESEESCQQLEEETPAAHRCSPAGHVKEGQNFDMGSQKISNQLHGTIALMRSSMKPTFPERGSAPATPELEHTRSTETFSGSEKTKETVPNRGSVRPPTKEEQLRILDQHFSQHLLRLRSQCNGSESGKLFPSSGTSQNWEAEYRTRPQEENWKNRASLMDHPGASMYVNEFNQRGQQQISEHKELPQHLIVKQYLMGVRSREELIKSPVTIWSDEKSDSYPTGASSWSRESRKEERNLPELVLTKDRCSPASVTVSAQRRRSESTCNDTPDRPLDLSDYGRGKDILDSAARPGASPHLESEYHGSKWLMNISPSPRTFCPNILQSEEYPDSHPSRLSNRNTVMEHSISLTEEKRPKFFSPCFDQKPPAPEHGGNRMSSCSSRNGSGVREKLSNTGQKLGIDAESPKRESNETDSSESESTAGSNQESRERKYICLRERVQLRQRKRTRSLQEPCPTVYRKSLRGRRKGRVSLAEEEAKIDDIEMGSGQPSNTSTSVGAHS